MEVDEIHKVIRRMFVEIENLSGSTYTTEKKESLCCEIRNRVRFKASEKC